MLQTRPCKVIYRYDEIVDFVLDMDKDNAEGSNDNDTELAPSPSHAESLRSLKTALN